MIAVLGVLKGHSAKIASDFCGRGSADGATVGFPIRRREASVASGTPQVGAELPVQGTCGSGNWPTDLPTRTCLPRESCETGYAGDWMSVQPVQRAQDPALPRVLVQRVCYYVCSAADADSVRQWQAGAAGTISWAKRRGFAVVVQDEPIFLRTGRMEGSLWSRVGDPVTASRHGRRDRTIVFGALAEDGTRLMRQVWEV